MLDRAGEWAAFVLTGAVRLPVWAVVIIAAFVGVVCTLAFVRGRIDGSSVPVLRTAVVLILVLVGWWVLDRFTRADLDAERRALDARTFELATRALMPGSALACLDALAGETVEDACEKAIFANPEATAAAVSYVAAQLSLLASTRDHARRGGASSGTISATLNLRRAIEADRFGIAAHVLATRDGCTPAQCRAFFLLLDASRVSANLAERPFEARVKSHIAGWPGAGSRPIAGNPPTAAVPAAAPPTPVAGAKVPNNLYFPSSASIPPVNIMTAEPPAPQPHDTTGTAETAAPPTPPRRSQGASQARPPPNPGNVPTRSAPLPLAPGGQ
jgi:hypothetical protein